MIDGYDQHKLNSHYGSQFLARTVAAWFGAETTIGDVRRMAVCAVCGAREPDVLVEPFVRKAGYSAGGYNYPPQG